MVDAILFYVVLLTGYGLCHSDLCGPTNWLWFMPSCFMWSDFMVYAILFYVVLLTGYGLCHPVLCGPTNWLRLMPSCFMWSY